MPLNKDIAEVLRTPLGSVSGDPSFGFEALEDDGSTKLGISEQVLAEQARVALVRSVPGVVFNQITAHRDERGQLMKIEVDYMDQVHDPSSCTTTVDFRK